MPTFIGTLLPLVPLVGWALWMGLSPTRTEGELLLSVPMPLLARIKMMGPALAMGVATLAIVELVANPHWWSAAVLLIAFVALVCVPTGYTLTTLGIRTGHGSFRRWTEFAGVRRSPAGAILVGGQRASSYPIYLSGSREDDEFVYTLRKLVLESYKGQGTERDRLRRSGRG